MSYMTIKKRDNYWIWWLLADGINTNPSTTAVA